MTIGNIGNLRQRKRKKNQWNNWSAVHDAENEGRSNTEYRNEGAELNFGKRSC